MTVLFSVLHVASSGGGNMKQVGGLIESGCVAAQRARSANFFFTWRFKVVKNRSHGVSANQYWKCSW